MQHRDKSPPNILIRVGNWDLPLVIRRNGRARRVILRLDRDGEAATVTLPPHASERDGIALAMRSSSWLAARLARLPARVPFDVGAVVPVLGRPHLIIANSASSGITAADGTLAVGGRHDGVAQRLHRWFRQQARHELSRRAGDKAARIGRAIGGISVRDPTSRWGSCTADGRLSFSWRLIMAPATVLDYVAAHEVAHLAVKGHGPAFWAMVRTLTDGMDEARVWLRRDGDALHRYG